MCSFCKGTGKYQLLNRFVDCDQCDTAPEVSAPFRCCRCERMLRDESPDDGVCNDCFAKMQGGVN